MQSAVRRVNTERGTLQTPQGMTRAVPISDARPEDAEALRDLFREYFAWLGPEGWFSDVEAELAALPGGYDAILVARDREEIMGCVAVRPLAEGACEMKRLYVRSSARGSGAGRALVEASIIRARKLGYRTMRLDTLPTMDAARALYLSLGFRRVERYNDNPIEGVLFFELRL
jgi:ribosomal protein S18 acetylase RimI-like enzyme